MSEHLYEVVVGNVGCIYSGTNGWDANKAYADGCKMIANEGSRAYGEGVTMLKDNEVVRERVGSNETE